MTLAEAERRLISDIIRAYSKTRMSEIPLEDFIQKDSWVRTSFDNLMRRSQACG